MKRYSILLLLIFLISDVCLAQKLVSKKSVVSFFSDAAIEDITATNSKSTAIFETSSGQIAFSIPIIEFKFVKALMQEHFNEKYMETEKFPKATFQGKLEGYDPSNQNDQNVTAVGKMTIHGVTNDISVPGTLVKQGSGVNMKSKFMIKLVDYKITIPEIMWQKIAEQVEVSVDFTLGPQ